MFRIDEQEKQQICHFQKLKIAIEVKDHEQEWELEKERMRIAARGKDKNILHEINKGDIYKKWKTSLKYEKGPP